MSRERRQQRKFDAVLITRWRVRERARIGAVDEPGIVRIGAVRCRAADRDVSALRPHGETDDR